MFEFWMAILVVTAGVKLMNWAFKTATTPPNDIQLSATAPILAEVHELSQVTRPANGLVLHVTTEGELVQVGPLVPGAAIHAWASSSGCGGGGGTGSPRATEELVRQALLEQQTLALEEKKRRLERELIELRMLHKHAATYDQALAADPYLMTPEEFDQELGKSV